MQVLQHCVQFGKRCTQDADWNAELNPESSRHVGIEHVDRCDVHAIRTPIALDWDGEPPLARTPSKR